MRSILLLSFLFWCFAPLVVLAKPDAPQLEEAAKWGNLSLRLVYDGDPPAPEKVLVRRPLDVTVEKLLVDAKDHGIANVCVYLYTPPGQPPVAVHPAYRRNAGATLTMAAAAGRFDPHVVFVRSTQTLRLANTDVMGYNFNAPFFNNKPFNVLLKPGNESFVTFDKAETTPTKVSCNIHPWMEAYLLVRDNPYAAVSNNSGELSIGKLPVGKHTFVVWHESAGFVRAINIGGKDIELPRGRWELEFKPGDNDLGEIKVKPDMFRRP